MQFIWNELVCMRLQERARGSRVGMSAKRALPCALGPASAPGATGPSDRSCWFGLFHNGSFQGQARLPYATALALE